MGLKLSNELGLNVYTHQGPYKLKLVNHDQERSGPNRIIKKGPLPIVNKKNPIQIISEYFDGLLKSVRPKKRLEFRSAIIQFWEEFDPKERNFSKAVLKESEQIPVEDEPVSRRIGLVYFRKRKSRYISNGEEAMIVDRMDSLGDWID